MEKFFTKALTNDLENKIKIDNKEMENMFSVFLLSYRNTSGSLGEREKENNFFTLTIKM